MTQLSMDAQMTEKVRSSNNSAADCAQLAYRYENKKYKIPAFQREPLLWPLEQRRSFISRLWQGPEPVGSVVIYQVEDISDNDMYILDGLQRLSTILDFVQAPENYGIGDPDKVDQLLMANSFPLQMRTYRDHAHAYGDFVRLQQNLQLTPYEQLLGKRSLSPAWTWFSHLEEKIHRKMDMIMSSYGIPDTMERPLSHQYRRHNLSLFLRFALGNVQMEPWMIGGKITERKERRVMETHLSDYLDRKSKSEVESKAEQCMRRLDNDRGLIWDAWQSREGFIPNRCPTRTIVRFLHTVGVFCHNNGTSPIRFKKFVDDVFGYANGDTQFFYTSKSGVQQKITLGMDGLDKARTLINVGIATEDIFISDSKQRGSNGNATMARGFDAGHELPISKNGPGPTRPEPSSINRARGNRDEPILER